MVVFHFFSLYNVKNSSCSHDGFTVFKTELLNRLKKKLTYHAYMKIVLFLHYQNPKRKIQKEKAPYKPIVKKITVNRIHTLGSTY